MTQSDTCLSASLALQSQGRQMLARGQIELLSAIDETGSISSAAKLVGISYKTAWDRVDAMNNLAPQPLVLRSTGGSQGGGTRLTDFGRKVVEGFRSMEVEHAAYVERLSQVVNSIEDVAGFIQLGTIKTSACNQFRGVVSEVIPGAVNASIRIDISDNQSLSVIVTEESRKQMKLEPGVVVIALVKSSSVMLSKEAELKVSARNRLVGQINRIERGAVNSDVTVDIGNHKSINAIITNSSIDELELLAGDEVCCFFKASSVILLAE